MQISHHVVIAEDLQSPDGVLEVVQGFAGTASLPLSLGCLRTSTRFSHEESASSLAVFSFRDCPRHCALSSRTGFPFLPQLHCINSVANVDWTVGLYK